MTIRRRHGALVIVVGLLGWLRWATPEWTILDYLGLMALSLAGFNVLAFLICALLAVTDLDCVAKRWVGDRLGYSYKDRYGCSDWERRHN